MADGTTGGEEPTADNFSEAELDLVRAVLAGEVADCRRRPIRASLIRDLANEVRAEWMLPPAGIRINKAIIQGCLDLEGCSLSKPLLIWHSRLEAGGDKGAVVVRDGRLKRLGLHSCTIHGNVVADRVEIENGLFIGGGKVTGTLMIRGGSVGGALVLEGTEVGDGKAAMLGAGVRVTGPLIVRRAKLAGQLAIPRAHLGAGIYAENMRLAFEGTALNAESARIAGDVLLDRAEIGGGVLLQNVQIKGRLSGDSLVVRHLPVAIDATGIDVSNGVSLKNARVTGTLELESAAIGKAFRADGIEVDGGETAIGANVIKVGGNWEMTRAKLVGQLRCPGADVEGQFRMTEIRIFGHEIAIRADGARIRGGCYLSRAAIVGLVRLPAAEIGNQFRLRGATIKVETGAALLGLGATFRRDVELNEGFHSVGAVILDHAVISGALDLTASHVMSAAITRAGHKLPAREGRPGSEGDEHALSLVDARIDRLVMPRRSDERPRGIVDLSRARVGSFDDYADTWPPVAKARSKAADGRDIDHLVLDGFSYEHLSNPAGARVPDGIAHSHADDRVAARRIQWLEGQPECDVKDHFKPQAWVALADRLAQQGYIDDARHVDIARRRRERRSHSVTASARWQSRLLDWFALYGHNPWRTVIWMASVVVLFAGLWAGAAQMCEEFECFDEKVFVVSHRDSYTAETFRQGYPGFHALAYSFDVFVPFVGFGYEDHWRPNLSFGPIAELPVPDFVGLRGPNGKRDATIAITIGGLLYIAGLIEAILGIVLTSLAVTGFTGLLRGAKD